MSVGTSIPSTLNGIASATKTIGSMKDLIPIPSVTGGAAGPAVSGSTGAPVSIVQNQGGKSWMSFAVIGAFAIVGLIVWKKIK